MSTGWIQRFKDEFRVPKLNFFMSNPDILLQPRWDIPPVVWLVYRCFMLVYTLSWLIYTALLFKTPKFLIFISHISYLLMVIYYLLALSNLTWALLKVRCSSSRPSRDGSSECEAPLSLSFPLSAALSLQWLLHSLMGCFSLSVSLLYWTVIHPSVHHPLSAFNIHIHVINSFQTAVDLLLSSTPVHLTHVLYCLLAGIFYILFAVVYWLLGCTNLFSQPYIYSILDFSDRPLVASLSILGVCLLCLPSAQFVLWNLEMFREWLVRRTRLSRKAVKRELWWCGRVHGGSRSVLDFSDSGVERTGGDLQDQRSWTLAKRKLLLISFAHLIQWNFSVLGNVTEETYRIDLAVKEWSPGAKKSGKSSVSIMEPAKSEMSILPNGKSHDLADDMCVPMKTMMEEEQYDDPDNSLSENIEFLPSSDSKKPRFTDFEGKTSFGMSVFNLGNAIMGSGILGLAYAMANTGILLFLFLLTAVAGLSCYSIHLLLKSSGVVGIRSYEQLGFRAFGMTGKMAAGIAITLQNIGAMSSYLYIVKSEFPLVLQAFLKADGNSSSEWYLNGNYLVVLVTWVTPVGSPSAAWCSSSVIYKKFQILCPFEEFSANYTVTNAHVNVSLDHMHSYHSGQVMEDETQCRPQMFTVNSQTAYTIPILAFAFVCHPEVLPIYTELRNPTQRKMQHVSNISILIMYTMYFLAALFGYLTFYSNVEAELLHTYSRIDPYDTLILCVRLAVLTAVTLTVPIVLFPVRRAIQEMLFPNKSFNWIRHVAIAVVLLSFINMLVIFAPNILGIFGIIGATSAPCLIFIFPAVFYIRIVPKDKEPTRSTPKIFAACFAGLGVLFMIMSLSFIIIDWTMGSSSALGGH
ncbi:hypothetical protein DNTS_004776 [Danionella cerebrum]|uniref:Amino acid transporter transmembrane domain-containing protein n=1 Tax=Danionella cerebrum TaxID=2873325 RepID=A0A553NN06_9TELE|nr:hypothetical protein DNTS_004776 [Danionella translucida]